MSLAPYHAKRDFKRTSEPRGKANAKAGIHPLYLIQKHAARNLHYDFRLELSGVLLSWAVPKGPSLDPSQKRLAVRVEDHPIEYGDFEGTIPKGEYGGGAVMLWDRGTWTPLGDAKTGLKKGHLKFQLKGKKLHGQWSLIRTRGYAGSKESWLLVKDTDRFAKKGEESKIIEALPDSVVSKRNIDEISVDKDNVWQAKKSEEATEGPKKTSRTRARKAKPALKAKRKPLPAKISPVLATPVKEVPRGDNWIHEVKYDGYRILSRIENGGVRLFSRSGIDWTKKFPSIAKEVGRLKAKSAWLDGEICAFNGSVRSDFQSLQNAISDEATEELLYFTFDLMYLDGSDLRDLPLDERRQLLERLISGSNTTVKFSPAVSGSGLDVFKQACGTSLEGIVSKRVDSHYEDGQRSRNWVKVKCSKRQEMVIGGFTDPQGSRPGFGALHLGVYEGNGLRYAGKVGTGFDDKLLQTLRKKLGKMERETSPFVNPPRGFAAKGSHWVSPKLVAEIEFTEWSDSGALRHPSFIALREDKRPKDVIREQGESDSEEIGGNMSVAEATKSTRKKVGGSVGTIAGVKISHPDKILFPEMKVTKLALAQYYESVAEWIIPHLKDRPVSLLRCPGAQYEGCFYQKHAIESVNKAVKRISIPESDGLATYFAVNNLEALVGLVQWGVVELHPWGSKVRSLEKPDRLIFDFDPGDKVSWRQLVTDVKDFRTLLNQLELKAFIKTTGGKGLHIVIPINTTLTWQDAKGFTKAIADLFAHSFPDRFVATATKSKRTGKNFVDYLRNGRGATAIAPFCVRARKNAPVSMPIEWSELNKDRRFDYFNIKSVPAWIKARKSDPWKGFFDVRQTITKSIFKQVGYESTSNI
jgi:bifunctional non-homologous end joining protein LigD